MKTIINLIGAIIGLVISVAIVVLALVVPSLAIVFGIKLIFHIDVSLVGVVLLLFALVVIKSFFFEVEVSKK